MIMALSRRLYPTSKFHLDITPYQLLKFSDISFLFKMSSLEISGVKIPQIYV